MRVIIDANVAIAAAAARGLCEAVIELCMEQHQIIFGEEILKDIRQKLVKKIKVPPAVVNEYLSTLRSISEIYKPESVAAGVCRDSDDDAVLGLVAPANAAVIITGDNDLLVLKKYKSAKILSPRQFWEQSKAI